MTSRLGTGCQSKLPQRPLWRSLSGYLQEVFGRPLRKVALDPGFGCPHRAGGRGGCSFCREESFVPFRARMGGSVGEQLAAALKEEPALLSGCLAYLQAGSATHTSAEEFGRLVSEVFRFPAVRGLFAATRPDCVSAAHLDEFLPWRGRRLLWLELGLQSSSPGTLSRIGRGHDPSAFVRARELARERRIPVCAHVILGLPGEGEQEMMATADFLAGLEVEGVKIHHLQVIRGARMEEEHSRGEVTPLTLPAFSALAAGFLMRIPPGTVIHRLHADAPEGLLIAPLWPGAAAVRAAVTAELAGRGGFQGREVLRGRAAPRGSRAGA